ncbi:MAG: hypothetical protein RLN76_13375 [Phycisphaeraceae bacterium]
MNIEKFLGHHGINANPFAAEEASLDPVLDRMIDGTPMHPDYAKILGRLDKPSSAVVFGEKGSGKTAIRRMIERHIARHNQAQEHDRVLLVPYDDLNPILDHMTRLYRGDEQAMLDHFGLADHQDAILGRAVTRFLDALLAPDSENAADAPLPTDTWTRLRKTGRDQRADLLILAAYYDQPASGSSAARFNTLRKRLRLGWKTPHQATLQAGILLLITGALLAIGSALELGNTIALVPATGISLAAGIALIALWTWKRATLWTRCRHIAKELRPIDRSVEELMAMLGKVSPADLARQPLTRKPLPIDGPKHADDGRYRLTKRLIDTLDLLDYRGILVLMDRVDEPTVIAGNPTRMRPLVWPMFDNKFFQQPGVGLKLLLPIELRHLLFRESQEFFQEARLDKQGLIDRLSWTGATLYDLCSSRLRACQPSGGGGGTDFYLVNLFDEDVTTPMLVDALDQMHQPRDAFKFVYDVIQEHCRRVPEDEENFRIPRLTLDNARQRQAQRVQDLYRGLSPA